MKNISIWKDIENKETYPSLKEDKEVDCLIIGGGITGASCLYHLKDTNLKVMLVEQNEIAMATTGNSTGKLTYLQNNLIDKIRNNFDDKVASLYLKSQIDAITLAKTIINKERIDCDLEEVSSYVYTNNEEEISKLKDLETFLHKNNINTKETTYDKVISKYMFKVNNTYTFHPVKFVSYLLKKTPFPVYEHTSIKKIEKEKDYYICYTDKNKIRTKWVIIASHYPYFIMPYLFPIKGYIEKSYLTAARKAKDKISLISYSTPSISIRNYKDYLIYLSNSHSINTNLNDKKHFEELNKKVNDLNLIPIYNWSNTDIITNDSLPYIGTLKDRVLLATGFNTWGLTNGILSGKILSDIVLNKENEYISLFNPNRKSSKQITSSITNIGKNLSGYFNGLLKSEEKHLCPHMYCPLIYNEVENTYDCPCHGSRFNKEGIVINAPANKNIKK